VKEKMTSRPEDHECLPGWIARTLTVFPFVVLALALVATFTPLKAEAAMAVGVVSLMMIAAMAIAAIEDLVYHRATKIEENDHV
jgi:ABC-type dipeptide/oligopeptide/nickel transport system permease subunit